MWHFFFKRERLKARKIIPGILWLVCQLLMDRLRQCEIQNRTCMRSCIKTAVGAMKTNYLSGTEYSNVSPCVSLRRVMLLFDHFVPSLCNAHILFYFFRGLCIFSKIFRGWDLKWKGIIKTLFLTLHIRKLLFHTLYTFIPGW